ncbi:hypothetical protein LJR066_005728 [Acidovorax sp. LjRoot66]|uniref:hypothetical protein n=1 Tax=Acidovorax sp. LjRoot66 TaxID=3342334 RepID=UPI003ED0E806
MPITTRTATVAADDFAFTNAQWHARQALYWREQKGKSGPVPPGRCEHHARRHERRVIEIALQSEITLANRARAAGAPA